MKNSTCRNLAMSKNHASPRSRARMHARARAHHAWLARSTSRPCMHSRVRGCTPRSMHAACVDASRQSTARSTRTSSTFLLASSYPPTPSYILAWGQHVTTPLPFSKRRARRLASGQKESCINSKGKRLESAEKRSRTTAVFKSRP